MGGEEPLVGIHVHDGLIEGAGDAVDGAFDHLHGDGWQGCIFFGPGVRGVVQTFARHDFVEETPVEQCGRIEKFARHDHAFGAGRADEMDADRDGVPHQVDAHFYFAVADARVVAADAKVAGGGDAGTAASGDALNGADHRLVDFLKGSHHLAAQFKFAAAHEYGLRVTLKARLAEVGADGEVPAFGANDDGAGFLVLGEVFGGALNLFHHFVGDGIALFGAVNGEGGYGAITGYFDEGICHLAS